MILVAGATGQVGGLITRGLLEKGKPVRILVRPASDYGPLVAMGAEPAIGDLKDRASLDAACAGIDTVVTTANSDERGGADTVEAVDLQGNRDLIEAARGAGVRHFIFVSAFGVTLDSPVPFLRAKAMTEATLRASGMTWTILAPEAFADDWVPLVVGAPALEGREVVYVGSGARRHSFVTRADVAAFAVAAVDNPAARDAYLPIGGPEAFSYRDAVAVFERLLEHPIAQRGVAPGQPIAGFSDIVVDLLAYEDMFDCVLDTSELARTYGVRLTSLEEVAERMVPAAVGV